VYSVAIYRATSAAISYVVVGEGGPRVHEPMCK